MERTMNIAGRLETYNSKNRNAPQIIIEDILIL